MSSNVGNIDMLIDKLPCLVAHYGEFTYECNVEKPCLACKARRLLSQIRKRIAASDFEDMLKMLDPIVAQLNLVDTVSK